MENKYLEKVAISEKFVNKRIRNIKDTSRLDKFVKNQSARAETHRETMGQIHDHIMNSGLPTDAHVADVKKLIEVGDRHEAYKRNAQAASKHASSIRNTRYLPVKVNKPNMAGKIFLKLKSHPKLVAAAAGTAGAAALINNRRNNTAYNGR